MATRIWKHRFSKLLISLNVALASLTSGGASYAQAAEEVSVMDIAPDSLIQFGEKDGPRTSAHIPGCVAQNISFPGGSTWQVCVKAVSKYGLIISHASFQKSPSSPFITVLFDGRLGEIFVPYHPGTPRFGDISSFNFPALTLSAAHCPAPNVILNGGRICRETQDRGVAWMNDALVRRGTEVHYWAVLDAANYNYIMDWAFRDDGTIVTRAGSTGPKLGGPDDATGHMHDFTWRLDIDLNGSAGDSAYLTRHVENTSVTPSTGTDSASLITTEGGFVWNAAQFNTIEITDSTLVNGRGRPTSYELVPLRTGTARHSEAFTKKDFWVTHINNTQLLANGLPSYVNGEATANADNVIWYTGSAHHESNMRDEDRQTVPVIWTGFSLVPHNLFEGTPFF